MTVMVLIIAMITTAAKITVDSTYIYCFRNERKQKMEAKVRPIRKRFYLTDKTFGMPMSTQRRNEVHLDRILTAVTSRCEHSEKVGLAIRSTILKTFVWFTAQQINHKIQHLKWSTTKAKQLNKELVPNRI